MLRDRIVLSTEEIETLPVSSVEGVIGLQAGVQGLSIRGGGGDEVAFMVNGLTMRNERNNTPFTSVSVTSIQEVQVQTGGFNAEYGNVRSGVINVVTKEGSRQRYSADAIIRYSPPSDKHFGESANDPNALFTQDASALDRLARCPSRDAVEHDLGRHPRGRRPSCSTWLQLC